MTYFTPPLTISETSYDIIDSTGETIYWDGQEGGFKNRDMVEQFVKIVNAMHNMGIVVCYD